MFLSLDMFQTYQNLQVTDHQHFQGLICCLKTTVWNRKSTAIFQRTTDSSLSGIPGVSVYMDDVIASGATPQEHLSRLE